MKVCVVVLLLCCCVIFDKQKVFYLSGSQATKTRLNVLLPDLTSCEDFSYEHQSPGYPVLSLNLVHMKQLKNIETPARSMANVFSNHYFCLLDSVFWNLLVLF